MIRRLLQSIAFSVIGLAGGWMTWCLRMDRPYVGVAGILAIFAGHSVFLGMELLLMNSFQRRSGLQTASRFDLLRAWLAEGWCALRSFLWRQAFRSAAFVDNLDGAEGTRGLLMVHGFVCNRGVWNGWYPRLLESGIPYIGLSLEPAFGSIDKYVGQIDDAIERLRTATGLPPVIVAHSMGGLAVRAWLRDCRYQGLHKVHRVVTLGTPHGGTALVKFNLSTNIGQMAFDSRWLRSLAQEEQSRLAEQFICVFSRCDNVVFPARTACLEGAESIEIPGCAHIQMVDHPVSYQIVLGLLTGTQSRSSAADLPRGQGIAARGD